MKLINQSAQYLLQQAGIDGIYKAIELAGRTSYLSWDKMTDDSAKRFVDMLIKSKHTSVLEHGTVYLAIPISEWHSYEDYSYGYLFNPYSSVNDALVDWENWEGIVYITTNYRVLVENKWLDDLKYLCEPTEFHEKRLSVKVITDIGVTREFNRHRTFSIVEQSTRYCNFSKDKFGNELTFIKPYWYNDDDENSQWPFLQVLDNAERQYMALIDQKERYKLTPQQARQVLPLSTKTEVVYTAFESDWARFFSLRLYGETGAPHPQAKALAQLIYNEFEKYGLIEQIEKYRTNI